MKAEYEYFSNNFSCIYSEIAVLSIFVAVVLWKSRRGGAVQVAVAVGRLDGWHCSEWAKDRAESYM